MTGQGQVHIVDLRDAPQFHEACVRQNFEQWGSFCDMDLAMMQALFGADNLPGTLPITLIATLGRRYAGCVSLRERTMGAYTHPEIYIEGVSPWLSNMWVADEARGHGVASKLTLELERKARELGISKIYSSTARGDSLYHKLGYSDLEQRRHKAETIYLIEKKL